MAKKSIYINGGGYGMYSEEYIKDVKEADNVIKNIFKRLVDMGYKPAEVCLDLMQCISVSYCEYSLLQGIEDRKKLTSK